LPEAIGKLNFVSGITIVFESQHSSFMNLFISSERTVREINREFKRMLPLLKLAYYGHKHGQEESSTFDHIVPEHVLVKAIAHTIKPGVIEINSFDTVAELEQRFQNYFGLPVQVYRKTGDVWIETVQTDNLSLEKQNNIGARASKPRYSINNIHTLFL
jgi:hypothetical protein